MTNVDRVIKVTTIGTVLVSLAMIAVFQMI